MSAIRQIEAWSIQLSEKYSKRPEVSVSFVEGRSTCKLVVSFMGNAYALSYDDSNKRIETRYTYRASVISDSSLYFILDKAYAKFSEKVHLGIRKEGIIL